MKLVATSDFRNTAPDKIEPEGKTNELHVHKGARFEIGGNAPFEKLGASDKSLVVALNIAGRIVDESQVELVKRIDAEVAAEKKQSVPAVKK